MSQKNKAILSCRDVSKSFDSFVALKHATFNLQQGDKIGLVGPNGSGKSTLLKIIAGIIEQDIGSIERAKNSSVGYIPQNFDSVFHQKVIDFLRDGTGKSPELLFVESLSHLQKLHLDQSVLERLMSELSGGEKTKIAVLRILLSDYDLFLLDEPTNNLDLDALMLLEDFVRTSEKTFIIISHDRMFLDRTVGKIMGIDEHTKEISIYGGNFSEYLKQKESERERAWKEYGDVVEKKEKIETVIENKMQRASGIKKSKPRDNDKMGRNFKISVGQKAFQKSARLLKDKLETIDSVEKPKIDLPLKVSFDTTERSGDKVLELQDIVKKLPEKTIGPLSLTVRYGDRLLLLGKNGAGKSTILKMIMNQLIPDTGSVVWGTKVSIGYLPQEDQLSPSLTVLEILKQDAGIEESLARKTLHRFRLSVEDMNKKATELSSGERSRLILAIMMTQNANCIILDEPSNHLDLEVLTELEQALADFKGTLIVVSHDRYFIQKLSFNRFYAIEGTHLKQFGSYEEYQNSIT